MYKWPGSLLAVLAVMTIFPMQVRSAVAQQPASMDATITFFYYEDLKTAAAFYEDLLQLTKTMDEEWVKIYRITATSSVGLVQNGRGFHKASVDKPAMLSIVTENVDEWYARMLKAKVPVRSELPAPGSEASPGRAPVRGFVVEDPGGYTIEFFTWRKTS